MIKTIRALAAVLLAAPLISFAAGVDVKLDRAPINPGDLASLRFDRLGHGTSLPFNRL